MKEDVMFDPETALTVEQYITQKGITGKVWVCPHIVSNGKISNPIRFSGIECTATSIPDDVKPKKVKSHFRELGTECIVWYNDEDYSYQDEDNYKEGN
jgi:hypothetical protein